MHDDYQDAIQLPRRQPQDFRPAWYEATQCCGTCRQGRDACQTPDACRVSAENGESDFGALEGLTRGIGWIAGAWAIVAAAAFLGFIIWG